MIGLQFMMFGMESIESNLAKFSYEQKYNYYVLTFLIPPTNVLVYFLRTHCYKNLILFLWNISIETIEDQLMLLTYFS